MGCVVEHRQQLLSLAAAGKEVWHGGSCGAMAQREVCAAPHVGMFCLALWCFRKFGDT